MNQSLNESANKRISGLKKEILPILNNYGVIRAGIFGSIARGEDNENSDLDLLIELDDSKSLLAIIGIKQDLEEKLGKKVDVVEYCCIHPKMKEKILEEEVKIT